VQSERCSRSFRYRDRVRLRPPQLGFKVYPMPRPQHRLRSGDAVPATPLSAGMNCLPRPFLHPFGAVAAERVPATRPPTRQRPSRLHRRVAPRRVVREADIRRRRLLGCSAALTAVPHGRASRAVRSKPGPRADGRGPEPAPPRRRVSRVRLPARWIGPAAVSRGSALGGLGATSGVPAGS
jgi:hypothetical protein